ncbi:MAG: hypothetical protein GY701_04655 [Sulfitobacter sp.]|nr:hypothetical protein [Sulfitobacter sp.]
MSNTEPVEIDPWTKQLENRLPMPQGVVLACTYDLHVGIDSVTELVCFKRTQKNDELWVAYPEISTGKVSFPEILDYSEVKGCAVRAPRGGSEPDAARRLFKVLVRSRVGYGWPACWHTGDLIDEHTYTKLLEELTQGLNRNAEAAREREAPVIVMARRLRLDPQPTGTSPTAWQARCPGTHHYLYISNTTNTFGCGWCKRKGGPEELVSFVVGRTRSASPDMLPERGTKR